MITYLEKFIEVILVLMIFRLIYILIKKISLKRTIKNILSKSEVNSNSRKQEYELLVEEYGSLDKLKFKHRLDMYLIRSGLKEKFTFLNAEIYLLITFVIGAIGFGLSQITIKSIPISCGIAMLMGLSLYLILYILTSITYEKIDNQIMVFLNILDNFATSTDDIVSIFQQTSPYVRYPLNKYCDEFVAESRTTGNIKTAFNNLEDKIENQKLKDIIKNLEISSRNDANYKQILDKSKEIMKGYFENKEKTKSTKKTGQLEICMCLAMGLVIIFMMKGMIPNLLTNLFITTTGNMIVTYWVVVIVICLWNLISLQKN